MFAVSSPTATRPTSDESSMASGTSVYDNRESKGREARRQMYSDVFAAFARLAVASVYLESEAHARLDLQLPPREQVGNPRQRCAERGERDAAGRVAVGSVVPGNVRVVERVE